MSFDISLIGVDGSHGPCVSLNPDEHYAIFGLVSSEKYKLLKKLDDYYSDADFTLQEISSLRGELEARLGEVEASPLREKIKRILALIEEGIARGKTVVAIAD